MTVVDFCTGILSYYVNHKLNSPESINETSVEMKRCAAYEVTTLARQKINTVANTAYELVTKIDA